MLKTKTIAINGSMLDNHPTGVGTYTYNIINSLASLLQNNPAYKLIVYSPTDSFINPGIERKKIPAVIQSSKYGKLAAFTRLAWNILYYPFQSRNADIRLSTTTHGSLSSPNQLITIHDLLSLKFGNISAHQRFYFRHLLPLLIKKAKHIIAVSETTKKDIIELIGCPSEKIKVIYNGYDRLQYNLEKAGGQPILEKYKVTNYFLAVGPTYPHKNFENLIAAYKKLDTNTRKEYPLVIAGGMKPYIGLLKKLVKDKDLEKQVHFIGYVDQSLMKSLYQEALVLVFPSLYEGFGFPLLEAMACGCPVATSNTSSMPEVCDDAAIYFDPLSSDSIFEALYQISRTAELRNELIKKGIERSKHFSWEKSALEFKILIDEQLN